MLHAVKAFNRNVANPVLLLLAGRGPWGLSRLEHRGRRTGALHATPVWAVPVSEGFLIPMPYGTDVDWARNLITAGEGVLQFRGIRFRVGGSRLEGARAARGYLPPLTRRLTDLAGIRYFTRAAVVPTLTSQAPPPP